MRSLFKNLQFKNNLGARLKKWPFSITFKVTKIFQNNAKYQKNSRNGGHHD